MIRPTVFRFGNLTSIQCAPEPSADCQAVPGFPSIALPAVVCSFAWLSAIAIVPPLRRARFGAPRAPSRSGVAPAIARVIESPGHREHERSAFDHAIPGGRFHRTARARRHRQLESDAVARPPFAVNAENRPRLRYSER